MRPRGPGNGDKGSDKKKRMRGVSLTDDMYLLGV